MGHRFKGPYALCRDAGVADAIEADSTGPWWARTWWHFDVFVRPWLLRGVAVAAAALSAVVLWGEVAVGVSANLSPLSHLVAAFENQFLSQVCFASNWANTMSRSAVISHVISCSMHITVRMPPCQYMNYATAPTHIHATTSSLTHML